MSGLSRALALRLRAMTARKISAETYLHDVRKLADLGSPNVPGSAEQIFSEMDRALELRGRIATLENKIRELEARR
jgi:hypothetical protein